MTMARLTAISILLPRLAAAGTEVSYLIEPGIDDYDHVAISPDGTRAYIGAWAQFVTIVDLTSNTVTDTVAMPTDDYIGGVGVSPDGRVFVCMATPGVIEIDPDTGAQIGSAAPLPWFAYEGRLAFTRDGTRAFLAGVEDVYVLDLSPLAFVDTIAGSDVNGLYEANPSWDWHRAWHIAVSPDSDRAYVIGDETSYGVYALQTVDGLTGGDWSSLTHNTYDIVDLSSGIGPWFALSQDGTLLYDAAGQVWSTATMQPAYQVPGLATAQDFWTYMVGLSPGGAYLFYQVYAVRIGELSFSGEGILVANGATFELIDIDGDSSNGITGIDLLGDPFNGHDMAVSPDGRKIVVAGGGAGVQLVELGALGGVVQPYGGGQGGRITVRIVGAYDPGTTASLVRDGITPIEGEEPAILANGIRTRFDLRGAELGLYDVVITPPAGDPLVVPDGFAVEPPHEQVSSTIIGEPSLVAAAEETVEARIVVQNLSNIDQENLTVGVKLSQGTPYKVNLPAAVDGGADQNDTDWTVAGENYPVEYIWIANLESEQSYEFTVTITGPSDQWPRDWDISLEVEIGFVGAISLEKSIIGDACSFGDAVVTAVKNEARRQGTSVSDMDARQAAGNVIRDTASNFGVAKVIDVVGGTLAEIAGGPVGWIYGAVSDLISCASFLKNLLGFDTLYSWDPNDKLSNTGIDGYVVGQESIYYTIRFENYADATANAQDVVITDVIDERLDLGTLRVVHASHPGVLSANVVASSRTVTFTFDNIGLPPNVDPPEGEGWVTFSINPVADLPSGTEIKNHADIVFDLNPPIVTPETTHVVDHTPPNAAVDSLSDKSEGSSLAVSWGDAETGVGVWDYDVFLAVNGGAFEPWILNTTQTSAACQGRIGDQVSFYAVARDRLGNQDPAKSNADTSTTLVEGGGDDGCGCAQSSWTPWLAAFALACLRRRWLSRPGPDGDARMRRS